MNERKIADPTQILALVPPTRQDIVDTLLAGGPMSARALASQLGVRASSLYYHLDALEDAGLVTSTHMAREDGRREAVYRVGAERLAIDYRPDVPANRRAVVKVVGSILRLARRDFQRAFDHPDARVDGPARNLRGARVKSWLGPAEQRRANELLDELAELFFQRRDPAGRTLCALSWVITPIHDRAADGR